jgi:type VI secretion system secreted protein Hcp
MAGNTFIRIKDVVGESVDARHVGEIDVLAWNWGMSQTAPTQPGAGGGSASGKVAIQNLSFNKYADKASPIIMKYCASGRHVASAVLAVRKPGSKPLEYIRMTMTDVIIASVTTGAPGGEERLTEHVVLKFAKVTFEYVPQKADGSGDVPVKMGWDIAANKEL